MAITEKKKKELKANAAQYGQLMGEVGEYAFFKMEELKAELNIHLLRGGTKKKFWSVERWGDNGHKVLIKGSFAECMDYIIEEYIKFKTTKPSNNGKAKKRLVK
jgi:hypothetical protein